MAHPGQPVESQHPDGEARVVAAERADGSEHTEQARSFMPSIRGPNEGLYVLVPVILPVIEGQEPGRRVERAGSGGMKVVRVSVRQRFW